jgi:hypothetical protein
MSSLAAITAAGTDISEAEKYVGITLASGSEKLNDHRRRSIAILVEI